MLVRKTITDDLLIYVRKNYRLEVYKYSEDQPRDEQGRWTSGGGSGGSDGAVRLRINLFDKGDPLRSEAFSIEEETGFEDICSHGSSQAIEVSVKGKRTQMNADEFADYLKANGYKGGDLRLAACSTGKGDNSFAQQLSKALGNKVKAPDDDIYYIPEEGILRIGSKYTNLGEWRTFDKGVEV